MRWIAVLGCVAQAGACGRISFDPSDPTGDGGPGGTASTIDAPAGSIVATFGDDGIATANVTRDTFLGTAGEATRNYGTSAMLVTTNAPARRPLIYFDVSSIPPSSRVFSASLRLTTYAGSTTVPVLNNQVRAYALRDAWDEGALDGQAGVANWDERQLGVAWDAGGAGGTSFDPVELGTFAPVATTTSYDLMLDSRAVEEWIFNPATNQGLLIMCGCDITFTSREGFPVASRPVLSITYVP